MTSDQPLNSTRLLEPEQLATGRPENSLLIQVTDAGIYHNAHINGALLVEPRELVCGIPPAPGKVPDAPQISTLLGQLGYQPDICFIVYDDEGGGWAGRFIWTLELIGHQNWIYLNGGLHAWNAAGLVLDNGAPPPRGNAAVKLEFISGPRAQLNDVLVGLDDPRTLIWDARSEAEFQGLRSGAARAGHIPGAVHLDWLDLQDPGRGLRLREDLRAVLSSRGITPEKRIITHCQTHHRSSLAYLAARLLNFPDIKGYDGSWAEWGNRDDTPIETSR